ncbi:MAG: hypothetical protein ACYS0I_21785 [Planctomycetota bacterium]|jgi:hypothetical protein
MLKKSAIVFFLLYLTSCYHPTQEVIQGKCIYYDDKNKIVYIDDDIDDELTSDIENIAIYVNSAQIGAKPFPNDWLRISFKKEEKKLTAFKVMNLTRQKKLLSDIGIEVTENGLKRKQ